MNESQIEELLKQLIESVNKEPDSHGKFTNADVVSILNCGPDKARRFCKQLLAEGKIKPVRFAKANVWGVRQTLQGWEVVTEANDGAGTS